MHLDLELSKGVYGLETKIKNLDPKLPGRIKTSVELVKLKKEKELEFLRYKEGLRTLTGYFTLLNRRDWVELTNELRKNNKPNNETFVSLVKSQMCKVKA